MNTILKKHYILLGISIVVFLTTICFGAVALSKINANIVRVGGLKEKLTSYQINKKAFNDETAQLHLLQDRLTVLEHRVIGTGSVPELLSNLETLAQTNQTEFEITSVQTLVENDKPKLVVEFATHGSYEQISSFLEALEHQSFEVNFRKLYVFSEEGTASLPEVSGTLSVGKTKSPPVSKEVKWQGVATIEVVSFQ